MRTASSVNTGCGSACGRCPLGVLSLLDPTAHCWLFLLPTSSPTGRGCGRGTECYKGCFRVSVHFNSEMMSCQTDSAATPQIFSVEQGKLFFWMHFLGSKELSGEFYSTWSLGSCALATLFMSGVNLYRLFDTENKELQHPITSPKLRQGFCVRKFFCNDSNPREKRKG